MESNTSSLLQKSNHDNNDEQDNEKMQFLDEIFRVNEEEENKKDEEIKIEEDFIINTNIPRTRKKLTSTSRVCAKLEITPHFCSKSFSSSLFMLGE